MAIRYGIIKDRAIKKYLNSIGFEVTIRKLPTCKGSRKERTLHPKKPCSI